MLLSIVALALSITGASAVQQPLSTESGAFLLPGDSQADKPWFCHDNECPPFDVIANKGSYQVRKYKQGEKWTATSLESVSYTTAVSTGYKRIYQFLDGANDRHIKIPLTTPVVTRIVQPNTTFARGNYSVGVWLPKEFQNSPPRPTADEVSIVTANSDKVVYVLQFGGYLVEDLSVSEHAKKLKMLLLEDRVEFDEDAFFAATYDTATRLTNRHNEIWYAGDDQSRSRKAADE